MKKDILDRVAERALEKWNCREDTFEEFIYGSDLVKSEILAVTACQLLGQVANGGFMQWFENGYGGYYAVDILMCLGTGHAEAAAVIVSKACQAREEYDNDTENENYESELDGLELVWDVLVDGLDAEIIANLEGAGE